MPSLPARLFLAAAACVRSIPYQRGKDRFVLPALDCFAWLKPGLQGATFRCPQADVMWTADLFPDIMTKTMLVKGTYQDDVVSALRALVKPGDVVMDVGAHHGLMSIAASRLVGKAGRVIAFEPNPDSLPILARHFALNGVENVTVEPLGLMDKESIELFYANRGSYSWNSTFVRDFADRESQATPVEIRTTTLDEYCEATDCRPSLLKIDTEGSEFLVLNGSRRTLERTRPHIVIEFNPISAQSAGVTLSEIAKILRALNYELYVLQRDSFGRYSFANRRVVQEADLAGAEGLQNVVCVSQQRSQ
jgi:FkbM family methyltransferase